MTDTISLLQKIPLFKTLTLENLHLISSKVEAIHFETDQMVFKTGDVGDALYIIQSGSVHVMDQDEEGEDILLAELSNGSYFGEMALLTGEPRSASIKTSSGSILLKLSKDDFQLLLNRNAAMYIPIAYVLSQRLKEGNEKRLSEELERKQRYTPSGQLTENSLIDILKYCEENALTGTVFLRSKENKGRLDYKRGDITKIILNDEDDPDFLNDMLAWTEGSFRIEPKPFSFKQKENTSSSVKVTEDLDEFTLRDLITVLNLVCQHAVRIIGKTIVESFLKRTQKALYKNYPELYIFSTQRGGSIDLYEQSGNRSVKDEELIAVTIWIKHLIHECSRYELRFESFDIKHVTHSYYDILQHIGFYDYYLTAEEL